MKPIKMSLATTQNALSREEMKKIMAGKLSDDTCGTCKNEYGTATCVTNAAGGCNCPINGTCG